MLDQITAEFAEIFILFALSAPLSSPADPQILQRMAKTIFKACFFKK